MRKLILPVLAFMVTLALLSLPASAQQQTGQVQPETRVPQRASGGLFPQGTGVQTTGGQDVLNQGGRISIPPGRPAPPLPPPEKGNALPWVIASFVSACIGLAFVTLYLRANSGGETTVQPAPLPEPEQTPRPKQTPKQPHKKHKKRKHRR